MLVVQSFCTWKVLYTSKIWIATLSLQFRYN